MGTKITFANLTKLLERLGSCVTIVKPLELMVTEVYDVIRLLETLKFIQISDGTQLWKRLFEELVQSSNVPEISSSSSAQTQSAEPEATDTLADSHGSIEQEHSELQINDSSNTGSVEEDKSLPLVERSAEEESSCRESRDDVKGKALIDHSLNEQSHNNDDVLVIEVKSGSTPADKDDSWASLYQRDESPGDNESFELFIMEIKQKRTYIKSTPCPGTAKRNSSTAYYTAMSDLDEDKENDVKRNLFEEISDSVRSRRSISRRKSFTHVTVTEDCIEAVEYLEDDGGDIVTEESDLVKMLSFDEDNDRSDNDRSFDRPAALQEKFIPTPSCTPVSIMENLKTTYCNVNFNKFKEKMTQDLFCFYNVAVFDSKLPGDFEITWNVHLTKTAGLCYYSQLGNKKMARIELSCKVCTDFERLRDVLIHELCHAATWMLDGVKCGHGLQWKNWTQKACQTIPSLPVVHTCHQYEIHTKHSYHCTRCDYSIGRHSKSINLATQRCPLCTSQLKLQPKLKADGTPRKQNLSPFAKFVKENYSSVRRQVPQTDHGKVMSELATMYKQNCTV